MPKKQKLSPNRPPVSARISEELKEQLLNKHPNPGEISKLINVLLQKYADGRIIGVKLEV